MWVVILFLLCCCVHHASRLQNSKRTVGCNTSQHIYSDDQVGGKQNTLLGANDVTKLDQVELTLDPLQLESNHYEFILDKCETKLWFVNFHIFICITDYNFCNSVCIYLCKGFTDLWTLGNFTRFFTFRLFFFIFNLTRRLSADEVYIFYFEYILILSNYYVDTSVKKVNHLRISNILQHT